MIQLHRVSHSFRHNTVLSDVTVNFPPGEGLAIVGPNGAGKSTLLAIAAGILSPQSGTVTRTNGLRLGYCPQELSHPAESTVMEYLRDVTGLAESERQLEIANDRLADGSMDGNEYADIQQQFEHLGGYDLEPRAQIVLAGLGLADISFDRQIRTLSGGQKTKLALAGILLLGIDVLFLDEPTNNLDLPSVIWLEDYLTSISSTSVVICHDRRFLDHIATGVIALDPIRHRVTQYSCSFAEFEVKAAHAREQEARHFFEQQRAIEELREHSARLRASAISRASGGRVKAGTGSSKKARSARATGRLARQARNIERQLEEMDPLEKPYESKTLRVAFERQASTADIAISVRGLIVEREGFVLGPINFDVPSRHKAALLGGVGSGKSTLLKAITGTETSNRGFARVNGKVAYYAQDFTDSPSHVAAVDFVRSETGVEMSEACRLLKGLGIRDHELMKKVGEFSPGGRARLRVAVLMGSQPDVLILDEPTNHMDMEAIQALENGLRSYGGTLLVASHDRRFVENIEPQILFAMDSGALSEIESIESYEAETLAARVTRLPASLMRRIKSK